MQLAIIFPQGSAKGVEVPLDCVLKQALGDFVGRKEPVEWRFERKRSRTTAREGGEERAVHERQPRHLCRGTRGERVRESRVSVIPTAYAQSNKSIRTLLKDLESDAATVRYAARKDLAALRVPTVAPVIEH